MKMRAFLLLILMIGGTYAMIQSFHDYKEKALTELLSASDTPFTSLIFSKPSPDDDTPLTWNVSNETEIESLLEFLQDYHVRQLRPTEIGQVDVFEQFSISLKDENDNSISIIVNSNLVIQNGSHYYEIVDGPLDVDWLVTFFVNNQM